MRVLHMIPDIGISNGVMSVILNYAKAMPEDIVFDVVYFAEKDKTREKDIEGLGGKVYKIDPPSPLDLLTGKMNSFFNEHKNQWQALHIHCPHFAVFIAPYAKKAGIKKIAVHCHSTWYSLDEKNNFRNKMLYLLGSKTVDEKFACGRDAGIFWYKSAENFTVLSNAIDIESYRYNVNIRKEKRTELGLSNELVIGHVGRVAPPQKNHPFLIEAFAQVKKQNNNAVLLLAGADETPLLADLSKKFGVYDSIRFLGSRTDVRELLQAFDVFVFPSFWEGLPVAVVEAQAAGLPVIMSDSITDEVCVTDTIYRLSLNDQTSVWADKITEVSKAERKDTCSIMKKAGWDINDCAYKLACYYKN